MAATYEYSRATKTDLKYVELLLSGLIITVATHLPNLVRIVSAVWDIVIFKYAWGAEYLSDLKRVKPNLRRSMIQL